MEGILGQEKVPPVLQLEFILLIIDVAPLNRGIVLLSLKTLTSLPHSSRLGTVHLRSCLPSTNLSQGELSFSLIREILANINEPNDSQSPLLGI